MFLFPVFVLAQEDKTGNWIMYFGTNKVGYKFSIHTEIQYWSHALTPNNIEQLLLRAQYKKLAIAINMGFDKTSKYS